MFLTELKLHDFRNHKEKMLKFSPFINCVIGNNAVGKTNILEAIYYFSTLASFRAAKDEDLIRWGKEAFSLFAKINSLNKESELKITFNKKVKNFYINDLKKEKGMDFIGLINTVFFSPEDLSLVKGSPSNRRRFLDHFLSQLFPSYHHYLIKYRKLLRQKNIYLKDLKTKKTSDFNLLDVYDEQISQISAWITLKRLHVLKKLLPVAKKFHSKINPSEDLNFNYESCILLNYEQLTYENLFSRYLSATLELRKEEVYKCVSLIGPHRDDIVITINKKNVKDYGSQGQQRSSVISLKLAQAEIFRTELSKKPLILLDDIFSELDEKRRSNILSLLSKDMQVFITATDIGLIPSEYRENAKIIFLANQ